MKHFVQLFKLFASSPFFAPMPSFQMNSLNDDFCDILVDAVFHTRISQVYLADNHISQVCSMLRASVYFQLPQPACIVVH